MILKPSKPIEAGPSDTSRDFAGKEGFDLGALERLVNSIGEEPDWRRRADIAAAYYDGKQLTPLQEQAIRAEGLDKRCINLIRPVINSVLGQEARNRTDIKLEADEDEMQDVADVFSVRLKEAERETNAHMAVSDAYASMVKTGIGWVFVSRNADPLDYQYRVESIPRNEIWWDWRLQRGVSLDACRWVTRMNWIDLDELVAAMPKHRSILEQTAAGWDNLVSEGRFLGEPDDQKELMGAYDAERRFNVYRRDWLDTARKMVKVYEVWYRVAAVVTMIRRPDSNRKIVYDERDPRHHEAVARGMVQITREPTLQIRMALYAGPHRLKDVATTLRRFPYVPFFAFRDDEDKSPYGLIDGMIAPQDDYNERRHRIQWMLKARQAYIDEDALALKHNTFEDLAATLMRPDAFIVTNSQRKNANGIRVVNELSMQPEQFKVQEDSKELIQHTAGRFSSQLGSAQVQSGIANGMLIEQGEQAMGEMDDNYRFARRRVFEEVVELIKEDHLTPNLRAPIGAGGTRRVVVLNAWDPKTSQPVNQVKDATVKVGLSDVPSTPAARMQQQTQVANIIGALAQFNPQAAGVLTPAYVELSGLPDRQIYTAQVRKALGLADPADREGQERAQAMQEQAMQRQQQVQEGLAQAEMATKGGQAAKAQAEARRATAEAAEAEQRVAVNASEREAQADIALSLTASQLNQARAAQIVQGEQREAAANEPDEDALIEQALREALAA